MAWELVKSLGDHVLFIGTNTTASCSATDLGLKRGCLYYTMPGDQSLYKFEIEGNATTPTLPCLKLPTPWFSAGWMMMPTNVRVVDGRRVEDMFSEDREEGNFVKVDENIASKLTNIEKENQEQKQNGGQLGATPWGILNEDMVELIASYLHPVDHIHFRAVCNANRSIIPAVNWRSSSTGIIKNTYLSPWLIFSEDNDTIHQFVNPMHNNEKYLMNTAELLVGAAIRFSKGGWLLMSKGREILFFYNPFTRAAIQLPNSKGHLQFTGMSFSSLPTSSDCVVFGIKHWETCVSIFVIARGNDFWTFRDFEYSNSEKHIPCSNSPVFYDGAFYCLGYNGTLGVFNLEDGFNWKILVNPQGYFNNDFRSFLVECDGELLSVHFGHLGKSVGIFKLDFSKMVWVKGESLGKHVYILDFSISIVP